MSASGGPLSGLLVAFRDERILHLDDDLIVVDKPAGIVVHGGDAVLAEDLVRRLRGRLGPDAYLGVHQRLDKEASGVLLLTRSPALNGRVAADFEQHHARKTYVAAVGMEAGARLKSQGVMEDRLAPEPGQATRVVSSGGQDALTHYRVLERVGSRALLELEPRTGRTHQLRVQLAHRGAAIGGDSLYGGTAAGRLLLHAAGLELPSLGRKFEAPVPVGFLRWVRAEERAPDPQELEGLLLDAACARAPLVEATEALRLVNDAADGLDGVTVDAYGGYVVLSVFGDAAAQSGTIADLCVERGALGVYTKIRAKTDLRRVSAARLAPGEPAAGLPAPERLIVTEHGRRFEAMLGKGLSTGLFVDQRENRSRIQALAKAGDRCLNLFCYTGSFSVAAALGGARVTSVDISRSALEWARRHFALNEIDLEGHAFIREDAVAFLKRTRRRERRFEQVIVDPPSFATVGKHTFRVERDYPRLLEDVAAVLAPGGHGLVVTNHTGTSLRRLRTWVQHAARSVGRDLLQLKDLPSSFDCPPLGGEPHPSRSVLFRLK